MVFVYCFWCLKILLQVQEIVSNWHERLCLPTSSTVNNSHCRSLRLKILQHKYWSAADALSIVDSVTLKELTVRPGCLVVRACAQSSLVQEFVDTLRQQMYVEALVQGNMTSEVSGWSWSFYTWVIVGDFLTIGSKAVDEVSMQVSII